MVGNIFYNTNTGEKYKKPQRLNAMSSIKINLEKLLYF